MGLGSSFGITSETNNNIQTNGVIGYWDAAYKSSYPRSGTTWYDLAGSNNGTLTNSPTFNSSGHFEFDPSDDENIDCGTGLNSTLEAYTNSISVSVWFKSTNSSTRRGIIANYLQAQNKGFYIDCISQNASSFKLQGGYHQTVSKYLLQATNNNYSINTWYNVTMTIASGGGSGDCKFYVNGTLDQGTQYRNAPDGSYSVTAPLKISSLAYDGDEFYGHIAIVHLYNRELSAADILQNYNAQKQRFGV